MADQEERQERNTGRPQRFQSYLHGDDYLSTGDTEEEADFANARSSGTLSNDLKGISNAMREYTALEVGTSMSVPSAPQTTTQYPQISDLIAVPGVSDCGVGQRLSAVSTHVPSTIGSRLPGHQSDPSGSFRERIPQHGYGYGANYHDERGYGIYREDLVEYADVQPPRKWRFVESGGAYAQSTDALIPDLIRNLGAQLKTRIDNLGKQVNERLDGLVERVTALETTVQIQRRGEFPAQLHCLPLGAKEDVVQFEQASDEVFRNVVNYLGSLSNGDLGERANLIVKAQVDDELASVVMMQGGERSSFRLKGTRFSDALYAAIAMDLLPEHRPSRRSFILAITCALKAAKQRSRRARAKAVEPPQREANEDDPAQRP